MRYIHIQCVDIYIQKKHLSIKKRGSAYNKKRQKKTNKQWWPRRKKNY